MRTRFLAGIMLALALTVAFVAAPVNAQMQSDGRYTIQRDDTLWDLSEVYYNNPFLWRKIVERNPFLAEQGRQFAAVHNGRKLFVVLLHPGEQLVGLGELGVTPNPVPAEQFVERVGTLELKQENAFVTWAGWLLAALLLLAWLLVLALVLWRHRKQEHIPAAHAGPAVVRGGLPLNRGRATPEMMARFQQIADTRLATADPRGYVGGQRPERIGNVETGFLNGRGIVEYANNTRVERQFVNEPAYRATFRFPDGHEEEIVYLQQCGNDVTSTRYRNFTFTTEAEVREMPTPSESPAEPAPQHPAASIRVITPPTQEGTTLRWAGSTLEVPEGSTLDFTAEGIVVMMPGGAVFRAETPAPGVPAVAAPKAVPDSRSTG